MSKRLYTTIAFAVALGSPCFAEESEGPSEMERYYAQSSELFMDEALKARPKNPPRMQTTTPNSKKQKLLFRAKRQHLRQAAREQEERKHNEELWTFH